MKSKNLLYLLAFTLCGQVFFSCNTARHYEFSNSAPAYHSDKTVAKTETTATENAVTALEGPAPELSAGPIETIAPISTKPIVNLNEKATRKAPPAVSTPTAAPELKLDRTQKKELKGVLKQLKKQNLKTGENTAKPTVDIIELIFAIILPPIGVLLHDGGLTTRFWIALLLTLLFFFPGMIYALLVVTDTI